ncbi:MAG TPA: hypothetical protein VG603_02920 [Chitinophagales bacterium]|nr:hypothetical protein [Chitinophagales bacterium]
MKLFCTLAPAGAATALMGQAPNTDTVNAMYDSLMVYNIAWPKTVLAVAAFETGWFQCKNCTFKYNNMFGFRNNSGYLKFNTISDCLAYLKNWQDTYYVPWQDKHPTGNYYDFLIYIHYAHNMPVYLRKVKYVEKWLTENLDALKPELDPAKEHTVPAVH